MPVTLPQSVKTLLLDKAYGHVVTSTDQGKPQVTMVWMDVDGDEVTFNTAEGRRKPKNLRRDPRVCVVAEAGGGGGDERGVTVQGHAEFLSDGSERRALAERFHAKYPRLEHLWGGKAMPADRVMFRIVPARVRSWGLG